MTAKRFERIYEDVDVFCRDNNARTCQLIGREDYDKIVDLLNSLNDENKQLKQQKQQYKGQRDYLLFVIERTCSKELFEETKSYLKEVE